MDSEAVKHYRLSWDGGKDIGRVLLVVAAVSPRHAFEKALSNTLYQWSLLTLIGDDIKDIEKAMTKVDWEVEEGSNGQEITFVTFDEAAEL